MRHGAIQTRLHQLQSLDAASKKKSNAFVTRFPAEGRHGRPVDQAVRQPKPRASPCDVDQIARCSDAAMGPPLPVIEKKTAFENDSDLAFRTIGCARRNGSDLSKAQRATATVEGKRIERPPQRKDFLAQL